MTAMEKLQAYTERMRNIGEEYDETDNQHAAADQILVETLDLLSALLANIEVTRHVSALQMAYYQIYKEYGG